MLRNLYMSQYMWTEYDSNNGQNHVFSGYFKKETPHNRHCIKNCRLGKECTSSPLQLRYFGCESRQNVETSSLIRSVAKGKFIQLRNQPASSAKMSQKKRTRLRRLAYNFGSPFRLGGLRGSWTVLVHRAADTDNSGENPPP